MVKDDASGAESVAPSVELAPLSHEAHVRKQKRKRIPDTAGVSVGVDTPSTVQDHDSDAHLPRKRRKAKGPDTQEELALHSSPQPTTQPNRKRKKRCDEHTAGTEAVEAAPAELNDSKKRKHKKRHKCTDSGALAVPSSETTELGRPGGTTVETRNVRAMGDSPPAALSWPYL